MSFSLGTPSWIDYGTNDFAQAKAFYEGLFGWDFQDLGEEMGHYNLISKDGQLVGGAMDTSAMAMPDGSPLPSAWTVYLAVDDLDKRVALAQDNGATVAVPPGDAGTAGRFAILVDPAGAGVGLWQSGDVEGYVFQNGKLGTPVWFEQLTDNWDASTNFYTKALDFDLHEMEGMDDDPEHSEWRYATNGANENASSGICKVAFPLDQPFWRVYLAVDESEAAAARIAELGGTVLDGPEDSPYGRIMTVADPAGATFQVAAVSEATPM